MKKTPGVFLTTQKDTRGLSADDIERARRSLMRRDPRLGALIKRAGRCRLAEGRRADPFASLVRVILSQQLSVGAANTIHGRVVALAGGASALTPTQLLSLDPASLRTAGVSGPKVTYLHDLAARVADGRLDLPALGRLSDEDVVEAITSVRGLGRWSAEMFLIFRLNRPDVWPVGDLGIVKGVQKLLQMRRPPAPRTLERVAKPWRPYRSVAAWYLWRIHEL
ncbi:MAG TPA: DNA-3-methyladenine glycosylase [Vicinamibacterales bacterium]|nr:DNA-3-methyladenine glycosylase [Vicinamibacterales bacterium]